jgi:hypothetical protein
VAVHRKALFAPLPTGIATTLLTNRSRNGGREVFGPSLGGTGDVLVPSTHRLPTMDHGDEIVVLPAGRRRLQCHSSPLAE